MDIFLQVLDWINTIFIALTLLSTSVQLLYMIAAFFCKKVTFKEASTKHKVCILIPARNEQETITALIDNLKNQNYPKDKFDIVTIAHNCTDNTATIAKNAGSMVFECKSEERTKGMALKLAIDNYLKDDYEFFIVLDADCRVENDYISKMNDAFDSGAHIARSYLGNINTFDNSVSCVSALYNIRDGRITARVREKLGMNVQLIGNSFFMSKQLLMDFGGFPSTGTLTEDSDLMIKAMLKNYKVHYVEDAIAYTEVTNTCKELFKRNMRIGNGVNKDFWKYGYKLIGKFFTTFKITYIDIFLTLAFLPISFISCVWFPAYYIFLILKMIITGQPVLHMTMQLDLQSFIPMAIMIVAIMIVMLSMQGIVAVYLQKDRLLKDKKWKDYMKGIALMCPIMLVTNVAITCGILNPKQSWSSIKRTTANQKITVNEISSNDGNTSTDTTINNPEFSSTEEVVDNTEKSSINNSNYSLKENNKEK